MSSRCMSVATGEIFPLDENTALDQHVCYWGGAGLPRKVQKPMNLKPFTRRFGRRAGVAATALATVVMLGASSIPANAGTSTTVRATVPGSTPTIWPQPQTLQSTGNILQLPSSATIVTGSEGDASAVSLVSAFLQRNGTTTATSATDPGSGTTVYIGGPTENTYSAAALGALGVSTTTSTTPESYTLASGTDSTGRQRIVLSGADTRGTYYAAQSLRQITGQGSAGADVWGVTVTDAPAFAFRGGMQSFYGTVWTASQETSYLDFLAANKMDTYFYGPAGDPGTGTTWRQLYSDSQISAIQSTIAAATARHVDYVYRISPQAPLQPAAGICFSSDSDRTALLNRMQQLWDAGARRFTIAWDDVSTTNIFQCDSDIQTYGSTTASLARAQADVTNYVQQNFIAAHTGAGRLMTVPTEYAGTSSSEYRATFESNVSSSVDFWWTGPDVISPAITTNDLSATKSVFATHNIAIWDNYPVNDYVPDRLLLAPVKGRDSGLAQASIGMTFNAMPQEELSQLATFTGAAYTWNPGSYSPATAWDAALSGLGGSRSAALKSFAQNNYASSLESSESAKLAPLISAFRQAWQTNSNLATAASDLKAGFADLQTSVGTLRETGANQMLAQEADTWLTKANLYGQAGQLAVTALVDERNADTAGTDQARSSLASLVAQINSANVREGVGVIDPFLSFALDRGTDLGDLSGTGRSDLLAVMSDGTLNAYSNASTTSGQSYQDGATSFGPTVNVGGGWTSSMLPITGDLCGDRRMDLLSVDAAGLLRAYANTGSFTSGMFGPGTQVGQGWAGALMIRAVDLDADGRADLLGVLGNGNLVAVRNTGCTGGIPSFGPTITVGYGWSSSMLPITGDFTGDGRTDLLSIDAGGTLRSYTNTGSFDAGMFGPGTQVGQGWTGALMVKSVDLDGDGRADLLGVLGNGDLIAIHNNAVTNGIPSYGSTITVGSGWTSSMLPVITDLNGDGRADLLSVNSAGQLLENVNTGNFTGSMFTRGYTVGQQWQGALFIKQRM